MIRLFDDVYTWSRFDPEKRYNFNGFLLAAEEGVLVIDPPALSEDDRAYLAKLELKPELVAVTNRNHLRDSGSWRLPLAMHEAELDQVDVSVDRVLRDGETLFGGLEVVHLPGKSPGEFGLYWRARRLMVVGDALIAPFGKLGLVPAAKIDDARRLRVSLKRLAALDFEALLLADGDPVLAGAKAAVGAFARSLG